MKICKTLLIFIVLITMVSFVNAIEQEPVTNTGKAVTETNTMMECLQQKGCGGPEEEIKKGGLQFALQEISPEDEECYKQCNVDITCYFKETDACWAQTGYQDNDQQLIQCSSQSTENCAKNESFINRIINWLRNWFD